MKLRTSFVTNSSGSNTSRITIENKVLIEILKKYSEKMKRLTKINIMPECAFEKITDEKDREIHDSGYEYNTFWNFNNDISNIKYYYLNRVKYNIYKQNLEEKFPEIIEIFNELEKEIEANKEKIDNSYKNIEYTFEYNGDMGLIGTTSTTTKYNKDNICPKCKSILFLVDDFSDEFVTYNKKTDSYDDIDTKTYTKYYYCSNKKCDYKKILLDKKVES